MSAASCGSCLKCVAASALRSWASRLRLRSMSASIDSAPCAEDSHAGAGPPVGSGGSAPRSSGRAPAPAKSGPSVGYTRARPRLDDGGTDVVDKRDRDFALAGVARGRERERRRRTEERRRRRAGAGPAKGGLAARAAGARGGSRMARCARRAREPGVRGAARSGGSGAQSGIGPPICVRSCWRCLARSGAREGRVRRSPRPRRSVDVTPARAGAPAPAAAPPAPKAGA